MRRTAILLAILSLGACDQQPEGEPVVRAPLGSSTTSTRETNVEPLPPESGDGPPPTFASACKPAIFEGVGLTHCIADPDNHRIRTALAPNSGDNFGTIAGWKQGVEASDIAFVINAGMYGDDLRPIGYFVRNGDRMTEVDSASGEGNFYLKPNGVFFGSNGEWRILTTPEFVRTVGTRPQFGTQSGPMLLIGGELHPQISENGASRTIRNGVGIDSDGMAHFVISDEPISFGQLARFYRDELGASDALYLDGNISSLWDPVTGRLGKGRVGPLLIVERK